jgi:hypothetical protein
MIIYNEDGIKIYATGNAAVGESLDGTKITGHQFACEYDGKRKFYKLSLEFNSLQHMTDEEKNSVIEVLKRCVYRDRTKA